MIIIQHVAMQLQSHWKLLPYCTCISLINHVRIIMVFGENIVHCNVTYFDKFSPLVDPLQRSVEPNSCSMTGQLKNKSIHTPITVID